MKKLLFTFLIIIAVLIAIFSYERIFGDASFGPTAILAVSLLGAIFLLLLSTFLLMETKFKETMVKIWLTIISLSISFVFVELIASYILVNPLSPPLIPDEYRHHKLVPNTQSYFEQRDFQYYQRVNNIGLRGVDVEIKKAPGKYRILTLGDSFTMGKGVEDNQTFSFLVEELLNSEQWKSDKGSFEVLNGGVDSYAPILSYIQLTRELAPLDPDMVILNIDNSDLVQEAVYRNQAIYASDGEIIGVPGTIRNLSPTDKIRNWTERNLYITRLILFYANRLFGYKEFSVRSMVEQVNYDLAMHTLEEDIVDRVEQWQNFFKSIKKINNYCKDNSIKFLLTVYPWAHQVSEKEGFPIRNSFIPEGATVSDRSLAKVIEFSSDNNIPLINTFPVFRSYSGEPALFFNYDTHMTKTGYSLMASEITRYLIEEYWKE